MLSVTIEKPHADTNLRHRNGNDIDSDMNTDTLNALIDVQTFASGLQNIDSEKGMTGRTFKLICNRIQRLKDRIEPD